MLSHKRVVVTNYTTGLRHILVVEKFFKGQVRQLTLIFFDVENIWVGVHIFKAERVEFKKLLEPLKADVKLLIKNMVPWLL